jgi:hypothetical protein
MQISNNTLIFASTSRFHFFPSLEEDLLNKDIAHTEIANADLEV